MNMGTNHDRPPERPLSKYKADQLEGAFAARKSDRAFLEQLDYELSQRTTARAKQLQGLVARTLSGLEAGAPVKIPPVAQQSLALEGGDHLGTQQKVAQSLGSAAPASPVAGKANEARGAGAEGVKAVTNPPGQAAKRQGPVAHDKTIEMPAELARQIELATPTSAAAGLKRLGLERMANWQSIEAERREKVRKRMLSGADASQLSEINAAAMFLFEEFRQPAGKIEERE